MSENGSRAKEGRPGLVQYRSRMLWRGRRQCVRCGPYCKWREIVPLCGCRGESLASEASAGRKRL